MQGYALVPRSGLRTLFCFLALRDGLIPRDDVETDTEAGWDRAEIQLQLNIRRRSGERKGN